MYSIFLFAAGLVLGSFIDVMATRTVQGKNFLLSRSQCEACLKSIWPIDLIPLLSYVILKGKCRFCKSKISPRLFFIELLTGVLFVATFLLTPTTLPALLVLLGIIVFLLAVLTADILYGIIPDQFLIALGFLSLLLFFIQGIPFGQLLIHFLAGISVFLFFLAIFLVTRGKGMGFGDVKFSFFIGFLLSFPLVIASFYIAFLTGAVVSLILILGKKKRFKGSTIPFGPFMVLGTIVSLLFETQVLHVMHIFFGI